MTLATRSFVASYARVVVPRLSVTLWVLPRLVETKLFTSLVSSYLSDDEYSSLQLSIAANAETGDIVRGSGGVRKLRWSGSGRGKRGGIRIIYYPRLEARSGC